MSRPTMADVARAAGVSPTTVSHVMNDKGRVDTATRERVRAVAEKLGYAPSRAARSLALGHADTIGLLLPQVARLPLDQLLNTDWYGRIAVAASQQALAHRRALTILPELDASAISSFGLEGAIVMEPIGDDPRCQALDLTAIPYVLLGRDRLRPERPSVNPDTAAATQELLTHLVGQGARTVAVIAIDLDWSAGNEATSAYRQWCDQRGVTPQIVTARISGCQSREEINDQAEHAAHQLLNGTPRPDAIVGLFEGFGRAIVSAARALGLAVPGDLLVAQDVDELSTQLSTPRITAVDLQPALQVAHAIELLVSGPVDDTHRHQVFTPHLVPRESSTREPQSRSDANR